MKTVRKACDCHGACAKHILNEEKYFCIEDMGIGQKRGLTEYRKNRNIGTLMAIALGALILLLAA